MSRSVTIRSFVPTFFGMGLTVRCTFHFGTFRERINLCTYIYIFFKKFVFIDYHTLCVSCLVLMFCVEDHNENQSWTLLCFYPQLYLMSFHLCKAFVWYNFINQNQIKKIKKTALLKNIPNSDLKTKVHTDPWLKNRGTYRIVAFVYRYTPTDQLSGPSTNVSHQQKHH